jgi:hypothetical protein
VSTFDEYRSAAPPVPVETWAWNMYGPGVENIGRDGQPELFPVPVPGPDQLLVRVDAVGMCFSDVKLIKQGGDTPSFTTATWSSNQPGWVMRCFDRNHGGENLPALLLGQLAISSPIFMSRQEYVYGHTIPGGLTQFHQLARRCLTPTTKLMSCPCPETWAMPKPP